ncbi:uncharacterized protein TrAtP1_009331 [Trichoderma atroviride]|uniref:uncharacterized protein n=1 Tax=Hypocrea atroviridis TaxID=63577 RepID=UPI003325D700|nr:hypothetical protein TrAtP1_009331 [Trichoderma atroviride]
MATDSNIQPKPWTWTCHKCLRRYSMGSTQRCLQCGHKICYSEKNTVQSICSIQFDFRAWEQIYNARRSRLLQQSSPTEDAPMMAVDEETPRQQERERLHKMLDGTSSCFTDCRLPSECFVTMALNEMSKPANQRPSSSSSEPTSEKPLKTPKKAKKYKRQRRRNFRRMPSPLSQEWHIDDILDEEVDDDAVIEGEEERMEVAEGMGEGGGGDEGGDVRTREDQEREMELQFAIR